MGNNPIKYVDPDGRFEAIFQYYKYLNEHGYGLKDLSDSIAEGWNELWTEYLELVQKSKNEKDATDSDNDSHGATLPVDNQSTMGHIFDPNKTGEGHIKDTPENRKKLSDVGMDEGSYLGKDQYGNDWHAKTNEDGTQTWVESRSGIIWDGGINNTPIPWNSNTGLKRASRGW